jgi:hypothetical protein
MKFGTDIANRKIKIALNVKAQRLKIFIEVSTKNPHTNTVNVLTNTEIGLPVYNYSTQFPAATQK